MDNLQPTTSPKLWTTLNEILSHGPCGQEPDDDGELSGFLLLKENLGEDYGDDTPITLTQILESNGVEDAIWALRCGMDERFSRHLACDFAEHVLPMFEDKYPDDNRPRNAIEVSRRFADGNATAEELTAAKGTAWDAVQPAWGVARAAWDTAWSAGAAATAADWSAAWSAVWSAARAAWSATFEPARAADREWQAQRLRERYEEFTNV